MNKNMQYCKECSQRFDADKGGYYDKSDHEYLCKTCGKLYPFGKNIIPLFKKQSMKSIILKSFFACVCIAAIFETDNLGSSIILLVTAAILILTTVMPFIRKYRYLSELKEIKFKEAKEKEEKSVICPYCGASTKGMTCEYCGSPLDNIKNL